MINAEKQLTSMEQFTNEMQVAVNDQKKLYRIVLIIHRLQRKEEELNAKESKIVKLSSENANISVEVQKLNEEIIYCKHRLETAIEEKQDLEENLSSHKAKLDCMQIAHNQEIETRVKAHEHLKTKIEELTQKISEIDSQLKASKHMINALESCKLDLESKLQLLKMEKENLLANTKVESLEKIPVLIEDLKAKLEESNQKTIDIERQVHVMREQISSYQSLEATVHDFLKKCSRDSLSDVYDELTVLRQKCLVDEKDIVHQFVVCSNKSMFL